MTDAQELLRSAYQIAKRGGADTNWEAFKNNLERELMEQARQAAAAVEITLPPGEQTILRATSTAKTYRIYPSD